MANCKALTGSAVKGLIRSNDSSNRQKQNMSRHQDLLRHWQLPWIKHRYTQCW